MKKPVGNIRIYSPRGQVILLLLHVLSKEPHAEPKRRILQRIVFQGLLDFAEEDRVPYPSAFERGSLEERWMTLVAFARQDCVDRGWMRQAERDHWKITPEGRAVISEFRTRCANGTMSVRHGYLWSAKLKKELCPLHEPSLDDAKRPKYSIYQDVKAAAIEAEFQQLLIGMSGK